MNHQKLRWGLALVLLVFALPAVVLADYSMPVTDDNLSITEGLDETWLNVLLIGTDTREGDLDSGRSDTMMICSVNRDTGEIKLASLARDTWVTIGDNGHQNKLNAAHTFGGPNLLMQTINRTYQMNISQYVTVNFYGICDIVDALGGVTIALEEGEAGTINNSVEAEYGNAEIVKIPSGATEATLCGAQALAYARIRKLDNDFGRTNRQRKLLSAMLEKFKTCSLTQKMDFITTCFGCVSTNLSLSNIFSLSMVVIDHGVGQISMLSLPSEGHYHYDSADGTSKVIIDADQCAQELHAFIYE